MQQSPQKEKFYTGKRSQRKGEEGKDKFQKEREEKARANPIVPMNEKQKLYLQALQEGTSVILATGHAGTSKTYIPTKFACLEYLSDRMYKIAFSRPAISNSKSLGYFAGDKNEKMEIWLAPVLNTVKEVLGSEPTSIAIKREDIMFYPLEIIKGLSLGSNDPNRRMYFIVDEAEDLTIDEVKKIITRIGKNCTLVLAGDVTQSELKENSGLKWLIDFVAKHNIKDFVHIDFNNVNDIVRSNVVKNFITCLERDKREKEKISLTKGKINE